MMSYPRIGSVVQLWYGKKWRPVAPLHGRTGTVKVSGRGKPRNHGVEIDGTVYVVPCGNIRRPAP
jgi:hypothetical protein